MRADRALRRQGRSAVEAPGSRLGGVQAPTGGVKDSGFGREPGLPGIRNWLAIKNVGIRL